MNPSPASHQAPQQQETMSFVGEIVTETAVSAASELADAGISVMQETGAEAGQALGEVGVDIGAELFSMLGDLFS
jgi:hypothetical protein